VAFARPLESSQYEQADAAGNAYSSDGLRIGQFVCVVSGAMPFAE